MGDLIRWSVVLPAVLGCTRVHAPQPTIHLLLVLHFPHQLPYVHKCVLLTYHVNRFIVLMKKQSEGLFCFVCFFAFRFGLAEKSLDELFACCLLTDLWMFQWYCSSDLLFDQFRFHVNWCGEKNEIWYYSAISVAYFCWYTCDSLCKLTCLALPADISMTLILLCKLMFSYSAVLLCSHAHSSG